MEINQVVPATPATGDGAALQPAALSEEVRNQLLGELDNNTPAGAPASGTNYMALLAGVVIAVGLAIIALYIIKRVAPYEDAPTNSSN